MTPAAQASDRPGLGDKLRFLRGLIANPRSVASIFPSSRALARRIAAQLDPETPGLIVEFGPGTGVVTEALLERGISSSRLLLVEAEPQFVKFLRERFPAVRVLCRNALEFDLALEPQPIAAIICGLPLLNFDEGVRTEFVDRCLRMLGMGAPFVQLSFGWSPPVRPSQTRQIRSAGIEFRNLPPASVWVYTSRSSNLQSDA